MKTPPALLLALVPFVEETTLMAHAKLPLLCGLLFVAKVGSLNIDVLGGRPPLSGLLGGRLSPSPTFGPPRRLAHDALLPRLTRQLISPIDRLILSFVLEYIEEREQTGVRASRVPCDSALRSVCA